MCCGGCLSLKCTAGAPRWDSLLSSAAFQHANWKSIKDIVAVDGGDSDKTRWRAQRYDDDEWNTPTVVDVGADERFADVPDGFTTISDNGADTTFPAWKFRYNHLEGRKSTAEAIPVDTYVGCYVTKPSAPALSHHVGKRAGATAADTAIPLRRCAKMCEAYNCKLRDIYPIRFNV